MFEETKESTKSAAALREEVILKFWKENNIFEKSLEKKSPKGDFIFYEGPPTANGKPGIHHLEARAFKDAIPRYKTMQGYHVRRKAGWDTHGLPVELEVEKELGLKSKKEIEAFGVAEFNKRCKKSVWKYLDLWNAFTERVGFWVDQKDPYITYDKKYMESIWNVVKTIDDQDLIYKDYKVVPWCPRCGTALSSHELAQGYKDVKDLSVYVKFKLTSQAVAFLGSLSAPAGAALPLGSSACETPHKSNSLTSISILAWTTTPWTLLGNVALAVGEDIDYVSVETKDGILILAKARLSVLEGEYKIINEFKGEKLLSLEYEPLYPYLKENIKGGEAEKMDKAYKVYPAKFVTTEDGTGVVHTAVMYGADDFDLGTEIGLPKFHLVGDDGKFLSMTETFTGKFVKDEETAVDIIKDLAHRGLLVKKEKYEHSYPHCWRCKTPLIYFARDSWYVAMSKLRAKLVKENEKINWEPAHIKEGRFGEWIREVKDWAISRERYWGTPLPIWICENCGKRHVVGSVEDMKERVERSGNKYFVMRHGGAESNLTGKICSKVEDVDHLTEVGKRQVSSAENGLKKKNIDLIISSDLMRTRETAEIVQRELGLPKEKLIFDKRIRELCAGDYNGGFWKGYPHFLKEAPAGCESFADVKKRSAEFLYDLEKKYKNKNILIVTHESPAKLIHSIALGMNIEEIIKLGADYDHFKNAEIRQLDFVPISHNDDFELDLHKPYIDEVKLACNCGGKMNRVKEVMDVWFDSGTMPFSQDHYPFDFKKSSLLDGKKLQYPADFISEAMDQTRGWFYTLLAVGVLMGKGTPYKNVICLGLLLDAEGKKMSKSVGNIVDPWLMIEKYGVDTLRLWMYAVNQPGDAKSFDEKTVLELHRQVFGLLYNVLAFYELYREKELENESDVLNSKNILDQWILVKFDELNKICIDNMDEYKLLEPTRAIRDFIGDLSTWYLRRSRDRIKDGDRYAIKTLYFVLKNLAKILAPFAPFAADDIWLKLQNDIDTESVHLTGWPKLEKVNVKIIEEMEKVRKIVSLGLEARQKAGLKVRQPLSKIEVKDYELDCKYTEVIKDELNVKDLVENKNLDTEVLLDIEITPELKEEGDYRELVRGLQELRKKAGLTPSDVVTFQIETNDAGKKLVEKFEAEIKKTILAKDIKFDPNSGEEIKIDALIYKVSIQK